MAGEADVTIRYAFLPTESSIKESANKVAKMFKDKLDIGTVGLGGVGSKLSTSMKKSTGKMASEFDKTTKTIVDFLRMTQQKTSLQTKILSGLKFFEALAGGGDKTFSDIDKFANFAQKSGEKSGMSLGEFSKGEGEIASGGTATAAGTGGGVMGALGTIAGLLLTISIAMLIMSAFFDAVGPFIKVVMKMLSAILLILLMPFLKRIMPLLTGFFGMLINVSKDMADGMDKLFDSFDLSDPAGMLGLVFVGLLGPLFNLLTMGMTGVFSKIDVTGMFGVVKLDIEAAGASMKKAFNADIVETMTGLGDILFNESLTLEERLGMLSGFILKTNKWFQAGGSVYNLGVYLNIFEKSISGTLNRILGIFFNGEAGLDDAIYNINTWIDVTLFNVLANFANKVIWAYNEISKLLSPIIAIGTLSGVALKDYPEPRDSSSDYMGLQTMTPLQDFISRPGMNAQSFSSDDTIIGVKDTGKLGGPNITNNLYVSAGVDKKEFAKLLTDFSRQQGRDLRGRTSYYGR